MSNRCRKGVAIMKYELEEVLVSSITISPKMAGSNDPPWNQYPLLSAKISYQYFQPKD